MYVSSLFPFQFLDDIANHCLLLNNLLLYLYVVLRAVMFVVACVLFAVLSVVVACVLSGVLIVVACLYLLLLLVC